MKHYAYNSPFNMVDKQGNKYKLTMHKTLLQRVQEQPDCEKYTSWRGRTCYKTVGTFQWYMLMCGVYGLEPRCIEASYYIAEGNGFDFEYIEHDIIYAIE